MLLSRPQYDRLPRSSADLESSDEFKDKPLPRYRLSIFALARKTRRIFRVCRPIYVLLAFVLLLLWQLTFNASYTNPPPFNIPAEETVFIAANIIDGDLITGPWGKTVLNLVQLIGKDRVYVSIYGGPTYALRELDAKLQCDRSLVSEEEHPLDMRTIPRTQLPTGESRVKRIAYLAEIRNKALEPLDSLSRKFDKVLFINDVYFSAEDATRLLWGTNLNADGKSVYKATCGTDFVEPWKFYDTFATRDAEGYSIGVPIFPWFSNEGEAISRRDVLAGKDAVRVKSCWGGMTAFDARYLQRDLKGLRITAAEHQEADNGKKATLKRDTSIIESPPLPLRFRSEPEPFWDSSECCLIHADIVALPGFLMSPPSSSPSIKDPWDTGIYMNPYVRVTYDAKTQSHINFAKRFERLFALPQAIINHFAHMPVFNVRRTEVEGQVIQDRLWISSLNATVYNGSEERAENEVEFGGEDSTWQGSDVEREVSKRNEDINTARNIGKRGIVGSYLGKDYWASRGYYIDYERTATRGEYCGVRQLLVVKEGKLKEGEGNWDNLLNEIPPLGL